MIWGRVALLPILLGLLALTAVLVANASLTDALWWLLAIEAFGAWCAWALAWDWFGRRSSRRMGRRTDREAST